MLACVQNPGPQLSAIDLLFLHNGSLSTHAPQLHNHSKGLVLKHSPQESGYGLEPVGGQEAFGQHFETWF